VFQMKLHSEPNVWLGSIGGPSLCTSGKLGGNFLFLPSSCSHMVACRLSTRRLLDPVTRVSYATSLAPDTGVAIGLFTRSGCLPRECWQLAISDCYYSRLGSFPCLVRTPYKATECSSSAYIFWHRSLLRPLFLPFHLFFGQPRSLLLLISFIRLMY
jgi:hypothetical protein